MKRGWVTRLLGAVSGLIVWSVHFVAVYGLVGLGCDQSWNRLTFLGTNALTWLLIAVTVPALGLVAWIGWSGWRTMRSEARDPVAQGEETASRRRFMGGLTLTIAVIAFIATVMTALPIVMLPPCE